MKNQSLIKDSNNILRFIVLIIGMSGIRLDRPFPRVFVWILIAVIFLCLNTLMIRCGWISYYVTGCWILYFFGHILLLGTTIREKMISLWGEEKAYAVFETLMGIIFLNKGLAIGTACLSVSENFPGPNWIYITVAIFLFIIGSGCKIYAAWLTGLDIFYYKDLFINHPVGSFITKGPYKYFKNPIYGIGNLQIYSTALCGQSLNGLIWGVIFHISIYIFYYLVEKPFVLKIYSIKNAEAVS